MAAPQAMLKYAASAALVLANFRLNKHGLQRVHGRERAGFVRAHERAVSNHVSAKNSSQTTFHVFVPVECLVSTWRLIEGFFDSADGFGVDQGQSRARSSPL